MMANKKVLIITYYWPPAGGPGVQRWLKFVKYLPEFNITPIVYCPENPNYPILDESLQSEVASNLRLIKHPIKEPYKLASWFSKKSTKTISSGIIPDRKKQSFIHKLLLFIRGNFFIPDARKYWVKPSVRFLSDYIAKEQIDTVITTGPPHSLHLIGLHLKKQLDITWLADFRDPWTAIGYHKSLKLTKSSAKKHVQLELSVLQTADKIIVTSHHTKNEFQLKTSKPIHVITNGYDITHTKIKEKDTIFSLSHIGSLLSDRNPLALWEAISELIKEHDDFAQSFQLNLVGVVSKTIVNALTNFGLQDYVNLVGYVNHDEAIAYQQKSQVLLLIEIDSEDTKAIIPGKIFEYLNAKTPILAVGPKDADIADIIETTEAGTYFLYSEKTAIKSQLLHYYTLFKSNNLRVNPKNLESYSRRNLTASLVDLL